VAEELKDESYFYIFWKLHDNQIKDLLRKDGINGCLEKPMEFDKLLTAITSRGFFLTLSRSEQFSSFQKII